MNVLYLIRGVPGSGKSTLAAIIRDAEERKRKDAVWVCEADQYFTSPKGVYRFIPEEIPAAHAWCIAKVRRGMELKVKCIIVSNTFTQEWQLKPYRALAQDEKYKVHEIVCLSNFGNVHDCDEGVVSKSRKALATDLSRRLMEEAYPIDPELCGR